MIFRPVDSLAGMKRIVELPEYSRRGGDPQQHTWVEPLTRGKQIRTVSVQ